MATFGGGKLFGADFFALAGLSGDLEFTPPRPPAAIDEMADRENVLAGGVLTINQPLDIRQLTKPATRITSYFDDFYNRIYILPAIADFGAIAGETSYEFFVWNAFLEPKELTQIVAADDEGLTLDGPATPTDYKALQFRPYELTVTLDGPPTLGASYTFEFEGGSLEAVLPVLGLRAKLWPFRVNWRDPYRVSYEFKTDVWASRSGKEQRRALRTTPRKTITFTAMAQKDRMEIFKRLMASWQNKTMVMPEFTRFAKASVAMQPGETSMVLTEAAPWWLVEDATVCLYYDGRLETRKVQSVVGSTLNFASSSAVLWPKNTKVHPGLSGILASELRAKSFTDGVAEISVEFNVEPASEQLRNLGAPALEVAGREVWTKPFNWRDGVDVNFTHAVNQVDFGRGKVQNYYVVKYSSQVRQMTYTAFNNEAAEDLRRWFERAAGRRGEFYVPTGEQDVTLKLTAAVGTDTLRAEGTDLAEAYGEDTVYRGVAVYMKNGDVLYRYVRFIFEVDDIFGNDSVIQTDGQWPYDIEPGDVKRISWMPVFRFASDILTVEWKTERVAEAIVSVQTLENLPVDELEDA